MFLLFLAASLPYLGACLRHGPEFTPTIPQRHLSRVPVHPTPAGPSMTLSVIALGGDPTGVQDSTQALQTALSSAASLSASNALPGATGSGGVGVDLGGGTYRITSPLLLHYFNGIRVFGGTIVAGVGFPPTGCLLDVQGQGNLVFEDLTLDSNHTGGGMRVDNVVEVTVRSLFFLHYSSFGIWGDDAHGASHELLVTESFFAEFMWGEKGFDTIALQNGTGIYLAPQFYDSNFYNSIIRCTRVGVVNHAGANLFHGLHIYSTCNKDPLGVNVAVGMLNVAWGQTRVDNCYFDDSPLVIVSAHDLVVKNSLVYGLGSIIFAPTSGASASGAFVSNMVFSNTPYSGLGPTIHYDTTLGLYTALTNGVVVASNGGSAEDRAPIRTTRPTATVLAVCNSTTTPQRPIASASVSVSLDLRPFLLFLPNASTTPIFDWRAALGPALLSDLSLRVQESPTTAPRPHPPTLGGTLWGGAFEQIKTSPTLVSLLGAGGAPIPLASCPLFPLVNVAPTATPGVLTLQVALQQGLGGGGSCLAMVESWSVVVSVEVDQALPSVSR
jgi:hypothetical protein